MIHAMGCCLGKNSFIPLVVPSMDGDGPVIAVATLGTKKSIYLEGNFNGRYDILGTHNAVNFVPIGVSFFGFGAPQSLKKDVKGTYLGFRVRRHADATAQIVVAGQETCKCEGQG